MRSGTKTHRSGYLLVFMAPEVVTSPIFQPGAGFRFERHRPASVEIVDHD